MWWPRVTWIILAPTIEPLPEAGCKAQLRATSSLRGNSSLMRPFLLVLSLGVLAAGAEDYDHARQVNLHGAVTRIEWSNPRAYLFLNVKDSSGLVTNWAVDFGNPLDLAK